LDNYPPDRGGWPGDNRAETHKQQSSERDPWPQKPALLGLGLAAKGDEGRALSSQNWVHRIVKLSQYSNKPDKHHRPPTVHKNSAIAGVSVFAFGIALY